MDRDLLVRDTRIYVHALWRLLTDSVLPLDYSSYADELMRELSGLSAATARGVDLAPLIEAVSRLRKAAEAVKALGGAEQSSENTGAVNAALTAASRHLVPVDYTSGDRFSQDPALTQLPFPALNPLRRLCAVPNGDEALPFVSVAAVRARNRLGYAVDEAVRALEACLPGLKPRPSA
jgi:hypothetical protein